MSAAVQYDFHHVSTSILLGFGPFSSKTRCGNDDDVPYTSIMSLRRRYGTKAAISIVSFSSVNQALGNVSSSLLLLAASSSNSESSAFNFRAQTQVFRCEIAFLMLLMASSRIVHSRTTAVLAAFAALPLPLRSTIFPPLETTHAVDMIRSLKLTS